MLLKKIYSYAILFFDIHAMSADNSRGLLPLSVFPAPTAVFFRLFDYMKILAYLNQKCNSNRRFFPPERGATLRYATLRYATHGSQRRN